MFSPVPFISCVVLCPLIPLSSSLGFQEREGTFSYTSHLAQLKCLCIQVIKMLDDKELWTALSGSCSVLEGG